MSGTSADGIDGVLMRVSDPPAISDARQVVHHHLPFTAAQRALVQALFVVESSTAAQLCQANFLLGEWFAQAAQATMRAAGVTATEVDLIASHGQTVFHCPPGDPAPGAVASTLQIGEPAVIAERTGVTTVADFRVRDMAAGGHGAPLVSFVDALLFGSQHSTRAVLNLGGIANVTILPPGGAAPNSLSGAGGTGLPQGRGGAREPGPDHRAGAIVAGALAAGSPVGGTPVGGTPAGGTLAAGVPAAGTSAAGTSAAGTPAVGVHASSLDGVSSSVIAFDTGPGNMVLDWLAARLTDGRLSCDLDGQLAAAGHIDEALLAAFLDDSYFAAPPPKTTGRERYGAAYAHRFWEAATARNLSVADTLATATALTAHSVASGILAGLASTAAVRPGVPTTPGADPTGAGRHTASAASTDVRLGEVIAGGGGGGGAPGEVIAGGGGGGGGGALSEVIAGGGGTRNPTLMAAIAAQLPGVRLSTHEAYGIASQAKESLAFAMLGACAIRGQVNTLPSCTGAGHAVVMGKIVPGQNYGRLMRGLFGAAAQAGASVIISR